MKKILLVGESWVIHSEHIKGMDRFSTSKYEEGGAALRQALERLPVSVDYLPSHLASEQMPYTAAEFAAYDCVILSDVGSNTLLLSNLTFEEAKPTGNRCLALRDYVLNGGSFLMIGGYMSFTGIEGKARYGQTALQEVLPVSCLDRDDRVECPQGSRPQVQLADHRLLEGITEPWPLLLGYNQTTIKEGCPVLVSIEADPLVAIGEFGKGRSAVFTSDCAPHWGTQDFIQWAGYNRLWANLMAYLTFDSQGVLQ